MKKLFISFIALVIGAGVLFADPIVIGEFKYNLNSSTLTAELAGTKGAVSGRVVILPTVE